MLTFKKLANNKIILVKASSQAELNSTFLRFQEHYESPEFRNKIFTVGQFRQWYSEKYGLNSYEQDWSGFNIPSYILEPFIKGLFDPLTPSEAEFLNMFRYRTDKFYIIGAQDGNVDTLRHEIAHALYYIYPDYRDEADNFVSLISNKVRLDIKKWLLDKGYTKEVVDDETQAYLVADWSYTFEEIGQEKVKIEDSSKLGKSMNKLKSMIDGVKQWKS